MEVGYAEWVAEETWGWKTHGTQSPAVPRGDSVVKEPPLLANPAHTPLAACPLDAPARRLPRRERRAQVRRRELFLVVEFQEAVAAVAGEVQQQTRDPHAATASAAEARDAAAQTLVARRARGVSPSEHAQQRVGNHVRAAVVHLHIVATV